MRVLHVTEPTIAGVARAVTDAVAAGTETGWEVHVAAPNRPPLRDDLAREHPDAVLHEWDASRASPTSMPKELLSLRAIIKSVRPDVVHLHSSRAGLVGRLVVRGRVPTVFQPNAWSFQALDNRLVAAIVRRWERTALRWTDVLVCVSRTERDLLGPTGAERRGRCVLRLLPNAVDLGTYAPADEGRDDVRRRLGLPGGTLFVTTGRFSRQKAQDVLLRAWGRVAEEDPRAHLLLIGDGPLRTELEAAAPERTSFLGERQDVPLLLQASDVYVSASRWEGMSYAMLEGLASGLPIVCTDVAGAREVLVLRDDYEVPSAGAVVAVEDDAALSKEMIRRCRDNGLRRAEGAAARRRALARHDVSEWRRDMRAVALLAIDPEGRATASARC
jgi:glycosyltransferase involved in cell wall biosynthesis